MNLQRTFSKQSVGMAVAIVEPEIQQSKFQSHSISYRENVNVLPSLAQQILLCLRRSASIYPQICYAPYLTPLQVHRFQWAQRQALYEGKFAIRNTFSCTLEMCQLLFKQIKHLEAYSIVYFTRFTPTLSPTNKYK